MQFMVTIWNRTDMAAWISAEALENVRWDREMGTPARRMRLSAQEWVEARLEPAGPGIPFRAVVDVFYDALWMPADERWPRGAHVHVTYRYEPPAHPNQQPDLVRQVQVGIANYSQTLLKAEDTLAIEAIGNYYSTVSITVTDAGRLQMLPPPPVRVTGRRSREAKPRPSGDFGPLV